MSVWSDGSECKVACRWEWHLDHLNHKDWFVNGDDVSGQLVK